MQHPVTGKIARGKKYSEPVKRLPRPEGKQEETRGLIQRTERRWA